MYKPNRHIRLLLRCNKNEIWEADTSISENLSSYMMPKHSMIGIREDCKNNLN